ncbi:MAG: type II toxin-antitoxin system RelE/ParE family toxin, partial [Methanomicrobia archaeon]|nr:type II toxin-antitoxin system RelE/ParE family toxin [Methanomicrobia archaeon]
MSFEVHLSGGSYKFLKKLDKKTYEKIIRKIEMLANDPFLTNTKKIIGRKEKLFRVRAGDYRILYEVYLDKNVVLIVNIDKRSR